MVPVWNVIICLLGTAFIFFLGFLFRSEKLNPKKDPTYVDPAKVKKDADETIKETAEKIKAESDQGLADLFNKSVTERKDQENK